MKKINMLVGVLMLLTLGTGCSWRTVSAGNVGVKVYLLGGDKGVDAEVMPVGRYFLGINEELYLFPTFQQNYVWTKDVSEGSRTDESITFQTKEGMNVNVDVGISYTVNSDKVAELFQKYRRGVDEITDTVLRNSVRDALNKHGSGMSVEEAYSTRKTELFSRVQETVAKEFVSYGINVDKIYLINTMRLPSTVMTAINSKIEATQKAQQRENELREAEAQAKKDVAEAEGSAKSALVRAKAEAESNRILAASLTPSLVKYEEIKRWNGSYAKTVLGASSSVLVSPEKD